MLKIKPFTVSLARQNYVPPVRLDFGDDAGGDPRRPQQSITPGALTASRSARFCCRTSCDSRSSLGMP